MRSQAKKKKESGRLLHAEGMACARPAVGRILADVEIAGVHSAEPARGAWLGRGRRGRQGANSRWVEM